MRVWAEWWAALLVTLGFMSLGFVLGRRHCESQAIRTIQIHARTSAEAAELAERRVEAAGGHRGEP